MPANQLTKKNLDIVRGKCWCCFLEAREAAPMYRAWVKSNGNRNWNMLKQINLAVKDNLPVQAVAFYNYDSGWGYCERHIRNALDEM